MLLRRQHQRIPKVSLLIGAIILMLMVGNIWLSAHVSNLGIHLDKLEDEAVKIEKANQVIEQETWKQTSLYDLETIAESLGYSSKFTSINLGPENLAYQNPAGSGN